MAKTVAIIGAGKIGRGYLADLFHDAGYHIVFIDISTALVDKLNTASMYTLFVTGNKGTEKKIISNFEAVSAERNFDNAAKMIAKVDLACAAIYPDAFTSVASQLAAAIKHCIATGRDKPLNVFFFANKVYVAKKIRNLIEENLKDQAEKDYLKNNVGLIESLTTRGGVNPTPEMLAEDPLCISSSEGRVMPVGNNYVGETPDMPFMQFMDRIEGRLIKKVWCGNMLHVTLAAIGWHRGYRYNSECACDPYIRKIVNYAFDEANLSVGNEFGFTLQEQQENKDRYFSILFDCAVADDLLRLLADPLRKLSRDDRLIGPALLCLKHGILPYFLARGAAYLLLFNSESDSASVKMQNLVRKQGVEEAILNICGLNQEEENDRLLCQLIISHYKEIVDKAG
ncbi:MAG: 3-hydroxyacyl-CoA dehydrogenase NAD-binding domain-containing protein [Oscillospiraceae bacterium]|nr:3-hydroxyacyl-CoA dehydrogenase NAD-binding domain-containing protein [Oscillospiraceae bacterium]